MARPPATVRDRRQVGALADKGQAVTGDAVTRVDVDQGYPGAQAAQDAVAHHRPLAVVKLPEAKQGMVLLPKRGGGERRNAWAARCHRLACDDEQWAETLAGWNCVAFAILMLKRFVELIVQST